MRYDPSETADIVAFLRARVAEDEARVEELTPDEGMRLFNSKALITLGMMGEDFLRLLDDPDADLTQLDHEAVASLTALANFGRGGTL